MTRIIINEVRGINRVTYDITSKPPGTIEWATFTRVTDAVVEQAKKEGLPLEPFTVHDLRRTGSTLLNELGFNSDWIEKVLGARG